MAEKKNQHYVPQAYLRNFSVDKKNLWILNLKTHTSYFGPIRTEKTYHGPIKTQASLSYFYTKNIEVEDNLSYVEMDGIKVMNMLLDDSYRKLNDFEFASLSKYMILQLARTKTMADNIACFLNDQLRHKFIEQRHIEYLDNHLLFKFDYPSLFGLHFYLNNMLSFFDLEMKVIEIGASVKEYFVTSDNPVCVFNPYYQQRFGCCSYVNLYQVGLIVYFPISPTKAIFLYDASVYQVGNSTCGVVVLCLKQDVDSLNSMIAISDKNNIFYAHEKDILSVKINNINIINLPFLRFKCNRFYKELIRFFPIYLYLNPEMKGKIERVFFKYIKDRSLSIKL